MILNCYVAIIIISLFIYLPLLYFCTNELMKIYSEKKSINFKQAAVVSSLSHQFKRTCCVALRSTGVSFKGSIGNLPQKLSNSTATCQAEISMEPSNKG